MQVRIVVREPGSTKPEFSVCANLPAIPRVGEYISIHRQDTRGPHTEDAIVWRVWWRVEDFQTRAIVSEETEEAGEAKEIVVEGDPAIGPLSTDRWRDSLEAIRARGIAIEEFKLDRLSVREDFLSRCPPDRSA